MCDLGQVTHLSDSFPVCDVQYNTTGRMCAGVEWDSVIKYLTPHMHFPELSSLALPHTDPFQGSRSQGGTPSGDTLHPCQAEGRGLTPPATPAPPQTFPMVENVPSHRAKVEPHASPGGQFMQQLKYLLKLLPLPAKVGSSR